MLKMILDPMGGILCVESIPFVALIDFFRLTNDGNAILREIDVAHPAAKNMIELSRTQDEECGDGTTSVIILGASPFPATLQTNLAQPEKSSRSPYHNLSATYTLSSSFPHTTKPSRRHSQSLTASLNPSMSTTTRRC